MSPTVTTPAKLINSLLVGHKIQAWITDNTVSTEELQGVDCTPLLISAVSVQQDMPYIRVVGLAYSTDSMIYQFDCPWNTELRFIE